MIYKVLYCFSCKSKTEYKEILCNEAHCRRIFLVGSGNFWSENTIGDDKRLLYKVYTFLLFLVYCFMTVLEIMAAIMGDFPEDEKLDSISFAVSHTIVLIKIFSIIYNKGRIKELNKRMIAACKDCQEDEFMAEKYSSIKVTVVAYFAAVYGSAIFFVFEGIRKMYGGSHFVTVVTYYPAYEDNSLKAILTRIGTTIILYIMMISMVVTVDSFTMIYLIMYKYKFIALRHYFEKIRENFDKLSTRGFKTQAAELLTRDLIKGLAMHSDVLKLSKEIDKAFGFVMALQVCLSAGTAVSLLLHLALSDQLAFVAGMKIIFFVLGLFYLLALFLCNAGEITYQASLLSDAIFYCGWHECPVHVNGQNVRKIVHIAIMQAQRPLVMKAFKMLALTYGTFIQVVRGTYSVFALFYAQDK